MIVSFVNSAALLGIILVGIPVAIHLIKFRRKLQSVPSVLLFTALRKASPRRRIEDVILLLLRILAVALLALLLARPFVERRSGFPSSDEPCQSLLAVVIDDGAPSAFSIGGRTAFDIFKERAELRLKALPPQSMALIATSCGRQRSPLMSPREAADLVGRMKLQPSRGDLSMALQAAWDGMKSAGSFEYGAVLVEALPFESVWSGVDFRKLGIAPESIVLDAIKDFPDGLDPVIELSSKQAAPGSLSFRLGGSQAKLGRAVIEMSVPKGRLSKKFPIPPQSVADRAFQAPIDGLDLSEGAEIAIMEPGRHAAPPLSRWFLDPPGSEPSREIVLLHDGSAFAAPGALVIHSALEAALKEPGALLKTVNCAADEAALRALGRPACIFIPPLTRLSGAAASWVAKSLLEGANAVVFPQPGGVLSLPGIPESSLPVWSKPVKLPAPARMALSNSPSLPGEFFLLYGKGLSKVSLSTMRPLAGRDGDMPVFSCGGIPALSIRALPQGGRLVLWGVSIGQEQASLLANPLFPRLLCELAFFGDGGKGGGSGLACGFAYDVARTLGVKQGEAVLSHPDGSKEELLWTPSSPSDFFIGAPGFLKFLVKEGGRESVRVRAANFPRSDEVALSMDGLAKLCGGAPAPAGDTKGVPLRPVPSSKASDGECPAVKHDLTAIVAALLALCLALESVMGALRSSRKGRLA